MKLWVFLFFLLATLKSFSQDNVVTGIVFDKDTKDRVASVEVHNNTTGILVYNNLKGEFKVAARPGDILIFTKQDYHPDTIKVKDYVALAIYLPRVAIRLREVTIHDTVQSPERRLEKTKLEYSKIYGSLAYSDLLTTPSSGGAGLSIDALWNSFSRSGRNAARLQEIIQNDYQQNVIDYRFNRTYVGNITGLKDEKLTEFMFRYRPGYFTTKTASDYEFVMSIRNNLKRFLKSKRTYTLPELTGK